MATSALLIALAGGGGAAVGGAVAQTVGFFVERYKVRIAAEQRKQDLRVALRRERRELAEARAREHRDRQAQIYDVVAFALEEIIQAGDWFDFMLSRRTEKDLATERMREVLGKEFGSFYDSYVEREANIRRQLITAGSTELERLRSLLYLGYTVVQEWNPRGQLKSRESPVTLWSFDIREGQATKQRLTAAGDDPLAVIAAYRQDLAIIRAFCVWGIGQIQCELLGGSRPDELPYRAPGYESPRLA